MNPAFGNDRNFVSMPGLGNLNITMRGNLQVRDVLYNIDSNSNASVNLGINFPF